MKNVKILYFLPYIVYRIAVRDNKGNPLYDHDWTEMNIPETVFSGFLNDIEIISEEVMHIGTILDINLNEGILLVTRYEYITVGLLASKKSKLLRDCVNNFTNNFENNFKNIFENEDEYENVLNELIKTPCSNPSEFFDLYDELKYEINELELKESKEKENFFFKNN